MKKMIAAVGLVALSGLSSSTALAQEAVPPPPAPLAQPAPAAPAAPVAVAQPTGQWVFVAGQGWVWVPAGTTTTVVEGVPYAYLYTPAAGWTWYLSPWGWGPYHRGPWVAHPWRPYGWRGGWVAGPRVVARIGPRGRVFYHR